jgi:hypothetical protein
MATYTAQDFVNVFTKAGVNPSILPFLVAQVAHETGNFKSKLLRDHNNGSGITWINNSKVQKNAKKGRPLPEDPRYFYAKFDTLQDWAIDHVRVLNRKSKPIQATNVDDFVSRLKANGYFTAPIEIYKKAVAKFYNQYKNILPSPGAAAAGGTTAIIIALIAFFLISKKRKK